MHHTRNQGWEATEPPETSRPSADEPESDERRREAGDMEDTAADTRASREARADDLDFEESIASW